MGQAKERRRRSVRIRRVSNGLLWTDPSDDGKPEIVVSGCFEIVAESRDDAGCNWGILLRWKDPDGRSKDWAMPRSLLAGDGLEVRRVLLDGGLYIGASAKARTLPDGAVGAAAFDEHFILQTAHVVDHAYNIRGSLIEWQHNIARFAVGNSRLALAISAAFASCLVGPCGAESGGIHFRGRSSVGKTTALNVAGSVWGGGDRGFIRSWRATANGLEATAAAHSDGLLCLDEISQLGGREVGEIAYMLANGQGKARASREAALRKRQVWRLLSAIATARLNASPHASG
jgi:putative DNA primase/helicase